MLQFYPKEILKGNVIRNDNEHVFEILTKAIVPFFLIAGFCSQCQYQQKYLPVKKKSPNIKPKLQLKSFLCVFRNVNVFHTSIKCYSSLTTISRNISYCNIFKNNSKQ